MELAQIDIFKPFKVVIQVGPRIYQSWMAISLEVILSGTGLPVLLSPTLQPLGGLRSRPANRSLAASSRLRSRLPFSDGLGPLGSCGGPCGRYSPRFGESDIFLKISDDAKLRSLASSQLRSLRASFHP